MNRPYVEPKELLQKWRLSFVANFISSLSFIQRDIQEEMDGVAWEKIKDKYDLQHGPWNTRCRCWAILQGD